MNPVEISEVISLIEMVLKFASSTDGCSPDTKIKSYLHKVLRYPEKKNLISKTVSFFEIILYYFINTYLYILYFINIHYRQTKCAVLNTYHRCGTIYPSTEPSD